MHTQHTAQTKAAVPFAIIVIHPHKYLPFSPALPFSTPSPPPFLPSPIRYVLLKERNKLLTMKHEAHRLGFIMPGPTRLGKVD